jgi:carbonic anhydrase/acetyltransferase-like protein (isoleucine patch superfamily)
MPWLTSRVTFAPILRATEIHPSAYIDSSAQIIGNVKIEKNAFVAPLAVIRADMCGPDAFVKPVIIGEEVNIQDGVIIHTHGGESVTVGARTTLGHGVVIHGPCSIGEECFLSMRSTLFSATLENSIWIGMGAIVMRATLDALTYVPEGSVIRSRPDAWGLRLISSKEKQYMEEIWKITNSERRDYLTMRATEEVDG